MPKQQTKGTRQLGAEVDADLLAEWQDWCAKRKEAHGETGRYHIEMAMRRHMKTPPPPVEPPDPPLPPVAAPKKRGRPPKAKQ